jgi:CRISPR-associated protein Cmr6
MDRYAQDLDFRIPAGSKEEFLRDFAEEFCSRPPADFSQTLLRRGQALAARKTRFVERIAQTRLVVGLGLPHPTETGFLFDRITGCPYLPGSSVKGLLRAAARLVAGGELEGDRAVWTEKEIRRIFGPELGGEQPPQTGSIVFYDAFPKEWPRLEVDVLTPHHRDHNDKKAAPADWDEPNPVPFLAIAPGAVFRFAFGPGDLERFENDFPKLESLLGTALDWLGIGAKKAAGYGVFGEEAVAAPELVVRAPLPPKDPPKPPPSPSIKESVWDNVELGWSPLRTPAAFHGKHIATCAQDLLDPELLKALKKHNKRGDLRGDVVVVKTSSGDFRLHRVLSWRKKS